MGRLRQRLLRELALSFLRTIPQARLWSCAHLLLFGSLEKTQRRILIVQARSTSHSFLSPAVPLSPRQQTQARVLRTEIAALRKDAQDAKEQPNSPQNEEEEEGQAQPQQMHAEEHEGYAVVQLTQPPQERPAVDATVATSPPPAPMAASPPSLPEVVDDSATWRRRYEHLAGLLAEQTKRSSDKVSIGERKGGSVGASSTVLAFGSYAYVYVQRFTLASGQFQLSFGSA